MPQKCDALCVVWKLRTWRCILGQLSSLSICSRHKIRNKLIHRNKLSKRLQDEHYDGSIWWPYPCSLMFHKLSQSFVPQIQCYISKPRSKVIAVIHFNWKWRKLFMDSHINCSMWTTVCLNHFAYYFKLGKTDQGVAPTHWHSHLTPPCIKFMLDVYLFPPPPWSNCYL